MVVACFMYYEKYHITNIIGRNFVLTVYLCEDVDMKCKDNFEILIFEIEM